MGFKNVLVNKLFRFYTRMQRCIRDVFERTLSEYVTFLMG